jgi:hypothetical protein
MKKQLCQCGCGKWFPANPRRKYFNRNCKARVDYWGKRKCKVCGKDISHRSVKAKICEDIECYRVTQREQRKKKIKTYGKTECEICGDSFTKNTPNHKHGSTDCRKIARQMDNAPLPNRSVYIPQPGDWRHGDYLKEQEELKKKNGWKCRVCGEDLTGVNRIWCKDHHEQAKRYAAIDRTDGDYGGGGHTGTRSLPGVM